MELVEQKQRNKKEFPSSVQNQHTLILITS